MATAAAAAAEGSVYLLLVAGEYRRLGPVVKYGMSEREEVQERMVEHRCNLARLRRESPHLAWDERPSLLFVARVSDAWGAEGAIARQLAQFATACPEYGREYVQHKSLGLLVASAVGAAQAFVVAGRGLPLDRIGGGWGGAPAGCAAARQKKRHLWRRGLPGRVSAAFLVVGAEGSASGSGDRAEPDDEGGEGGSSPEDAPEPEAKSREVPRRVAPPIPRAAAPDVARCVVEVLEGGAPEEVARGLGADASGRVRLAALHARVSAAAGGRVGGAVEVDLTSMTRALVRDYGGVRCTDDVGNACVQLPLLRRRDGPAAAAGGGGGRQRGGGADTDDADAGADRFIMEWLQRHIDTSMPDATHHRLPRGWVARRLLDSVEDAAERKRLRARAPRVVGAFAAAQGLRMCTKARVAARLGDTGELQSNVLMCVAWRAAASEG